MKFLIIFATALAVAVGFPAVSIWTIGELSAAIQDPTSNPAQVPYLENALHQLMEDLFAGGQQTSITVALPITATWTLEEVTEALHDSNTNPTLLPYLEHAFDELMAAMINGQLDATITVNIPAMTVNIWTLHQLTYALQHLDTDPKLIIYLEFAFNQLMAAIASGQQVNSIAVVTPPGVIAVPPAVVAPAPVDPEPIIPVPVDPEEPVLVAPLPVTPGVAEGSATVTPGVAEGSANVAPVASSPLVQIIVNVITNQVAGPPVAPIVVDQPEVAPLPVSPPLAINPAGVPPSSPPLAINPAGVPSPASPLHPSVQPRFKRDYL